MVYLHDRFDSAASADLSQIRERFGVSVSSLIAEGDIQDLVLTIIGHELVLIPTTPERCTPMIRKVQAIALQMDKPVQPAIAWIQARLNAQNPLHQPAVSSAEPQTQHPGTRGLNPSAEA